ncbi:hypothetical protein HHX48_00095 [Salinimonas sp. HHU 13199]|uniref:HEPN domain-containing protein n=1 Tax=Salinimonas profundi TaxID=2729140 RepID=A0ABR8LCS5_9ALTE|nr:hypothetical protein [Salinimonas profundi]MBD3584133.1 hypothetical protein [Salinimonas profundi]
MDFIMKNKVTEVTLYRSALEYLKVINITQKSEERCPQTAFGFIASLASELALKAFLTKQCVPEGSLRNIGHNLVQAWSKSVVLGLNVDQEVTLMQRAEMCLKQTFHILSHGNTEYDFSEETNNTMNSQ